MMQVGLPTAHNFTRLSSPPVAITRADFRPRVRVVTAPGVCATNSSTKWNGVTTKFMSLNKQVNEIDDNSSVFPRGTAIDRSFYKLIDGVVYAPRSYLLI